MTFLESVRVLPKLQSGDTTVNVDWHGRARMHVDRWSRRALAIASVSALAWVAVGSLMFPGWWYRFFWNAGILSRTYVADGWQDFIGGEWQAIFGSQQPWLYVFGTLALICVSAYFSKGLLRFGSAHVFPLTLSCLAGVFVISILLYKSQSKQVEAFNTLERTSEMIAAMSKIDDWAPPPIEPPVEFRYLDSVRVEGLYSQFEPEFLEKQRTISSERGAGASLEIGGAKAEGSGKVTETSSFQKRECSISKECIDLMNVLVSQRKIPYYTTAAAWQEHALERLRRISALNSSGLIIDLLAAESEALAAISPAGNAKQLYETSASLRRSAPLTSREEDLRKLQRSVNSSMESELSRAGGLLIVDGIFNRVSSTAGIQRFEATFSKAPRVITFRFGLPIQRNAEPITTGLRLRVFGNISHQLKGGSFIEVFPIAVF